MSLIRWTAKRESLSISTAFHLRSLASLRACLIPYSSARSTSAPLMNPQNPYIHLSSSFLTNPPYLPYSRGLKLLPSEFIFILPVGGKNPTNEIIMIRITLSQVASISFTRLNGHHNAFLCNLVMVLLKVSKHQFIPH